MPQFLPEFLGTVNAADKRVPHAALPQVLDVGRRNNTLRELIAQVLTERGIWLAQQNPDWAYAITLTNLKSTNHQENFEIGALDERSTTFCALRQLDPDSARNLLAQGWSKEVAKARVALLEELKVSLSPADEAFLEAALDDKSKTVRAGAADLLARLPNSAYTQRMVQRAKPLLQFKRGGLLTLKRPKLLLTLPDELDDQAEQDGLNAQNPPRGVGRKAWQFKQIIARVPLQVWTEDATLEELLKACPKDEHALLLESWIEACQRFSTAEHAVALLDYAPTPNAIQQLAHFLSGEHGVVLAANLLQQDPLLVHDHPLLLLLGQTKFSWPQQLRTQLLQSLTYSTKKWKHNYDGKRVLDSLVLTLPLDLLTACAQLAPQDTAHPIFEAFSEFSRLSTFRQKMIAAVYDS